MVRIEIDKNGYITDSTACGTSFEMAAQISGAICSIYHSIQLVNRDVAEEFRFAISHLTAQEGKAWDTSLLNRTGNGMSCILVPPECSDDFEL